jgi:uncharacterized protein with HEPN domain
VSDDKLYLVHIRDCINDINEFVAEGRDVFMVSRLIQAAVLYKLQTASESTQRLSDAVKNTHPEVNWRAIRGFRNVVVHNYISVKLEEVWNIIERDLPVLKNAVETILQSLEPDEE